MGDYPHFDVGRLTYVAISGFRFPLVKNHMVMSTHRFSAFSGAALLLLLALAPAALAQTFDFTFTDGGVSATGSFDVTAGIVTDGSLTLTGAAVNGTFALAAPPTVRGLDGTDIIFDNQFSPTQNPTLDGGGLGFGMTEIDPAHYDYVLNLWGNSANNYSLFEAGKLPDGTGHVYQEYDGGTLSFSQVPEPSTYAVIIGAAALGFAAIRRRRMWA
jgi:hypothetical protein